MIPGAFAPARSPGVLGALADVAPPEPAHLTSLLPFALLLAAVAVTAVVVLRRRRHARRGPAGHP